MTDHELKYYEALQPKIKEAMGEKPEPGDRIILSESGLSTILTLGKVCETEIQVIPECCGVGWILRHSYEDAIRLPLAIDSDGPDGRPSNRCLWGMLKSWTDAAGKTISSFNGISPEGNGFRLCTWSPGNGFQYFDGSTPVEALLKALAHQEGIEVKE